MLLWTIGLLLGRDVTFVWGLAKLMAYIIPISAVALIAMMVSNLGAAPQDIRRKAGEILKCVECGRPSVPGSKYCRYHLDLMKQEGDRESR